MGISIKEIQKISKPSKADPYHLSIFSRKISPYFDWVLLRLGFSSNMVTLLSFVFILIGGFFFTSPDLFSWVIGWMVLQIYHILDCSDGEVARIRNTASKFGGMFDAILHPLGNAIVFSAASIGIYRFMGNVSILYVGFACTIVLLMFSIIRIHAALRTGVEKNYTIENHAKRTSFIGKLVALFMEIGGPFNLLFVVSVASILIGIDFSFYFYIIFTFGIFLLFLRKMIDIKKDMS